MFIDVWLIFCNLNELNSKLHLGRGCGLSRTTKVCHFHLRPTVCQSPSLQQRETFVLFCDVVYFENAALIKQFPLQSKVEKCRVLPVIVISVTVRYQ